MDDLLLDVLCATDATELRRLRADRARQEVIEESLYVRRESSEFPLFTARVAQRAAGASSVAMSKVKMTAQAFEDLAQALRVLLEARFRANDLFTVDFPEAVGNIEAGLTGVLNAFHSVYDAMQKDGISSRVDWYGTPELCTILALRNARHHNVCAKVRTLFRYHMDTRPGDPRKTYILADFKPGEEDGSTFDVPQSLGDLMDLLSLPPAVSRLRATTPSTISAYLAIPAMKEHAKSAGLSASDVFFNVVPLLVNAGIALHPHIQDAIVHMSVESTHFDGHFREVLPANTHVHDYSMFEFWRPDI